MSSIGGTKTRNLSVNQLFEILQEEYIVCELRAKIYPLKNHKEYWEDTAAKKKEKIIDIGKRNTLPTIFDDKRIKENYNRKVIPEIGFPNFIYRDDSQRSQQQKWDYINYYQAGKEVKVIIDGEIKVGNIVKSIFSENYDSNLICVSIKGIELDFNSNEVTRIF